MYPHLLILHSIFRWIVLASLIVAIYRAGRGFFRKHSFTSIDNKIRHWTATGAHTQLIIGILLYVKSPIVSYYWTNPNSPVSSDSTDYPFFGLYHFFFMLLAIVTLTVGSAKAKRAKSDEAKFRTMLIWFSVALLIILLAIPWPFSPGANRPYIRNF